MVNIGDTVLVTVQTWNGDLWDKGARLQSRLRMLGFAIVGFDDSALSAWAGNVDNLYVSLQPLQSAYGSADDIARIVAHEVQAVGYGPPYALSGSVIGRSSDANTIDAGNSVDIYTQQQQNPSGYGYEQNLTRPPVSAPSGSTGDWLEKLGSGLGVGASLTAVILAVAVVVVLKR